MAVQAYVVIEPLTLPGDGGRIAKGSILYRCTRVTYGLVQFEDRMTGRPHVAITLDPDGGYPFYVVPLSKVKAWVC